MMRPPWVGSWILLVAAIALGAVSKVGAQRGSTALSDEKAIRSDDWRQRHTAFISLIGADPAEYTRGAIPNVGEFVRTRLATLTGSAADRRKRLLFGLLERENATVNEKRTLRRQLGLAQLPPEDRLSEEYVNYYGDVVAAVAGLADIRSLDVLLDAITTGEMVRGTLISFGVAAVAPVALKTADADEQVRASAVFTLNQMLARSKQIASDPGSRRLISDTLQSAARDSGYLVRSRAVEGLTQLGDPDSIAIVKELARTDPYTYPPEYVERAGRYPVREAAEAALKSKGIK
jgi:hypothetical protein